MHPSVHSFFDEPTNTVSYVLRDPASNACAILDSVLDYDSASGRTNTTSADAIIAFVRDNKLVNEWIFDTHVHADHLSAAPYLKKALGGRMAIGEQITTVQDVFGKIFNAGTEFQRDGSQFDVLLKDGDKIKIGTMEGYAIHTPGHTPACMSYVFGDAAFVGDTLFMPDYGTARCDFPGGDAHILYHSIQKIFALPEKTRLFLCHDYKAPGREEYRWETTVAEERAKNVQVHEGISEAEFVAFRTKRDALLAMPKLIVPSVQINMRAGNMPPAEDNGVSYIKVPINRL